MRNFLLNRLLLGLVLAGSVAINMAFAVGTYLGSIQGFRVDQYTNATTSCTISSTGSGGCSGSAKGDCGTYISFTSASAVTVTLPQTIPAGCPINFHQKGAGLVSLVVSGSATLSSFDNYTKSAGRKAMFGVWVSDNSGGSAAAYVFFGRGAT